MYDCSKMQQRLSQYNVFDILFLFRYIDFTKLNCAQLNKKGVMYDRGLFASR